MRRVKETAGSRMKAFFFVLTLSCLVCLVPVRAAAVDSAYNDIGIIDEDDINENNTVINRPGSAENADDLKELNVSNDLTLTYRDGQGNLTGTLRILITLTLIALAPTIVIMMTSFSRILIVLHFVRTALGTQTAPPNQVLVGLSLFLTFFIMNPVITEINENAIKPFLERRPQCAVSHEVRRRGQ